MADPVTGAFAMKAASAAFSGLSAYGAAQGEKKAAEVNAYIGRTRAIQTDTNARAGLNDELGTFRATAGAMGGRPGVGVLEMMREIRDVRERERRIESGNRMSEAADYRMRAKNAGARGKAGLVGGAIKAGPSVYDLVQYTRGP